MFVFFFQNSGVKNTDHTQFLISRQFYDLCCVRTAMALRQRHPVPDQTIGSSEPIPPDDEAPTEEFSLASPKLGLIVSVLALFFIPFFFLLFAYYPIERDLRRSISICVAMSLGGLAITVSLIPVAARYLLRRNLFGYDINKRGTPQGAARV